MVKTTPLLHTFTNAQTHTHTHIHEREGNREVSPPRHKLGSLELFNVVLS